MNKVRILIVDEAVVVRRLMTNLLAAEPGLEVVGTAPNGRIALAKITQVNPDLVVLSADLSELSGPETLAAIRKTYPKVSVVLFSKFLQSGVEELLETHDIITTPGDAASMGVAIHDICGQLIPKIKRCCSKITGVDNPFAPPQKGIAGVSRPSTLNLRGRQPVEVIAIGASTGGPNALAALLAEFPADCPVPLVIVQHMPPVFTGFLAERLASRTAIGISEGNPGQVLHPGHAWIAPGDYHMELVRDTGGSRIKLHQAPPENSCRPSVDVLFRSVAEVYGSGTLAVVLTGMGQDGLHGCGSIRATGGQVLVQDEATSVVWGMPGFVARAGLADQVLPLDQLGQEIIRRLSRGRSLSLRG